MFYSSMSQIRLRSIVPQPILFCLVNMGNFSVSSEFSKLQQRVARTKVTTEVLRVRLKTGFNLKI